MVKTVKWNKNALRKLRSIVNYLQDEVSEKAANSFIDTVYGQIDSLIKHPEKGRRALKTKTIRFVNIDEHRQMFYRVKGTQLHISDFFDTRQNPNKRPY